MRVGVRIPSVLTNTLSYRNELSIGLTKRRLDRSGPPGEIRGKNQKKKESPDQKVQLITGNPLGLSSIWLFMIFNDLLLIKRPTKALNLLHKH